MSIGRSSMILLVLVVTMSIAVINVRHQARTLTTQLEQARTYEQQMLSEYSTRQVQQVAAAKNDKVFEEMTQQGMQRVNPSMTYYMTPTAEKTDAVPAQPTVTAPAASRGAP